MSDRPAYTWDPRTARYRDATGRFVPRPAIRVAVDAVIAGSTARLTHLSRRLAAGQLTLAEWQLGMVVELKGLHLAQAAAGAGGWAHLTPADFGTVGATLQAQYRYLARFAAEIAAGQQPLAGVAARAALYADAARGTYEATARRRARRAGYTQERNLLHAADSCAGCLIATAAGWVPLGTLVPVGQRTCQARCRCTLTYQ